MLREYLDEFVITYLNNIIKKDQYLLLLILEIQNRIDNVKIFLKINLKWVYYQIRIKEGDK